MSRHDIREISTILAARAEAVCQWLLPQGRRNGVEWEAGNTAGEPGKSLKVNLGGKAGLWSDFASGEAGDLIDLLGAVKPTLPGRFFVSFASPNFMHRELKSGERMGRDFYPMKKAPRVFSPKCLILLVCPARIELAAYSLGGCRSIQLSYGHGCGIFCRLELILGQAEVYAGCVCF